MNNNNNNNNNKYIDISKSITKLISCIISHYQYFSLVILSLKIYLLLQRMALRNLQKFQYNASIYINKEILKNKIRKHS